jgi:hypothetical protein
LSTKKHYQLKLFSPNNGVYEYSAVVTDNKKWDPKELLQFVCKRQFNPIFTGLASCGMMSQKTRRRHHGADIQSQAA